MQQQHDTQRAEQLDRLLQDAGFQHQLRAVLENLGARHASPRSHSEAGKRRPSAKNTFRGL